LIMQPVPDIPHFATSLFRRVSIVVRLGWAKVIDDFNEGFSR